MATGSGQFLTGDSGDNNVDGLVVKYTGTDENLNVGNVKVTIGTAELFDRVLYNITDPYDGYVTFKESSLQDNIDSLQTRMDDMEARLNQEQERMINQFVRMETYIGQMQSQSQWLSQQIANL